MGPPRQRRREWKQRLAHYIIMIIMILNRIQEAEKKPSKWNKIKEID